MSSPAIVGYDPNNAAQTSFLGALALGETGTTPWAAIEGVGGTNLSSYATDQYGFPQWGGFGDSHAAGTYQFQPGTWDALAKKYGLNFQSASDQNEGAWYYAQQVYSQKTGGSLSDALAAGDYSSVQSALAGVWPSVTGNGSSKGLAYNLANGKGATLPGGQASTQNAPGAMSVSSDSSLTSWLVRGGLLIVGALVLVVALWQMLSQHSSVPSPGQTLKGAAKFALA
jgi:hypothetical protein